MQRSNCFTILASFREISNYRWRTLHLTNYSFLSRWLGGTERSRDRIRAGAVYKREFKQTLINHEVAEKYFWILNVIFLIVNHDVEMYLHWKKRNKVSRVRFIKKNYFFFVLFSKRTLFLRLIIRIRIWFNRRRM